MFSFYVCLFAVTYSALAIPANLPQSRGAIHKNSYGIVGGQTEDIKKYPYTVSIYADYLDRLVGGGAILNKYWIVCSAYEIIGYEYNDFLIRYGSSNAGEGGHRINLTNFFIHSGFSVDYPYDVALMKTSSPIKLGKEAKAVKLAKSSPKAGTVAKITGFGKSTDPSETVMDLKAADVKVLSKDDCQKYHSSLETSFCADSDGVGPCSSDIGDPLVCNNNLIGLYIGGDTCNYHGVPELYTDISVVLQWILDTIKDNSSEEEMEGIFDDDDDSSDSDEGSDDDDDSSDSDEGSDDDDDDDDDDDVDDDDGDSDDDSI